MKVRDIVRAQARLEKARATLIAERDRRDDMIRQAVAEGVRQSDVAVALGISRQAVFQIAHSSD
jgi:DNA-binding XRE family transcriptional regulator